MKDLIDFLRPRIYTPSKSKFLSFRKTFKIDCPFGWEDREPDGRHQAICAFVNVSEWDEEMSETACSSGNGMDRGSRRPDVGLSAIDEATIEAAVKDLRALFTDVS